ncbi:MAG: hypothetical protein ACRCSV_02520 [Chlamydiales bacterium]
MKEASKIEYISWITTNSLIKQFLTEEEQKKIHHYFSSSDLSHLSESKTIFRISHIAPQYSEILSQIHYTWLIAILQNLPKQEQTLFLSVLPTELSTKLASLLSCDSPGSNMPPIMQEFARVYLMEELLEGISYLSLETLPDHPLNRLLELSSKDLKELISTLGLHDLAIDMKKLIRSSLLKRLQESLSGNELMYIRKLQNKGENIQLSSLHLDKWNGETNALQRLIFLCGINRLAKAIYPCHYLLLWNISHRLNKTVHSSLYALHTDVKNKRIKEKLVHDILELILQTI